MQRVNYTCGMTEAGDQIGLLGDVALENGMLAATEVIIGHGADGFFVKESMEINEPITVITLEDGAECLNAGQGATLAFDGKRLNFTCGMTESEEQIGLLGDPAQAEGVVTAEKVIIGHGDNGFFVEESMMVPATLVSLQAPQ